MKTSIFVALLIAITTPTGFCLQCYTCDSIQAGEACLDPFEPGAPGTWISDCGEASNKGAGATHEILHKYFPEVANPQDEFILSSVCFKALFYNDKKENITVRSCSYLGTKNCEILTAAAESNGGSMEICESCTTALCNAGTTSVFSLVFAIISLIITCLV